MRSKKPRASVDECMASLSPSALEYVNAARSPWFMRSGAKRPPDAMLDALFRETVEAAARHSIAATPADRQALSDLKARLFAIALDNPEVVKEKMTPHTWAYAATGAADALDYDLLIAPVLAGRLDPSARSLTLEADGAFTWYELLDEIRLDPEVIDRCLRTTGIEEPLAMQALRRLRFAPERRTDEEVQAALAAVRKVAATHGDINAHRKRPGTVSALHLLASSRVARDNPAKALVLLDALLDASADPFGTAVITLPGERTLRLRTPLQVMLDAIRPDTIGVQVPLALRLIERVPEVFTRAAETRAAVMRVAESLQAAGATESARAFLATIAIAAAENRHREAATRQPRKGNSAPF